MPGSASLSNTTGYGISVPMRRCSCISTRRRGSISAASGTAMRTISRIRSSRPKSIAASALNSRSSFPHLQRRPLGYHGLGFEERIRRLGRSPGDGTDRRHRGSERSRQARCHSCRSKTLRVLEDNQEPLRIATWSRYGFVNAFNPDDTVVRHGCGRNRYRNHDADGGEPAHRICVEYVYEEPGSAAGAGSRRFRSQ